MPFAATWMQLEIVLILSEVAQKRMIIIMCYHLHVESEI